MANFYLTLTFAVEMALKLWALGPRCYSNDRFNVFDGTIVLFSLLELLLSAFGSVESLGGVVSSLRFFRLLRVLKLAKVRPSCLGAKEVGFSRRHFRYTLGLNQGNELVPYL